MSNVQSYNALIDRFHAFASGHFILKRFSHGQIEVSDLEKFGEYPFMHVVPSNVSYAKGMKTFSFQIVLADLPRDKEDKPEYQREVLSDLQRIAEDLVAEITNHRMLFGDLITVQNVSLEPFLEEFQHTLTGWTISLDLLVPYYWDACSIPAEWNDFFESGSGGTGSILTFIDSINRDANGNVSLVNDEETPAPNYYYGTNDEGVRGWYLLEGGGLTCETIGDCQTIIDIEAAIDALEEEIVLKADITSISAVGFSNDYNDLDNLPTIPTATSDLTNDGADGVNPFITAADVPAQVNADWNATSGVAEILNKPTIPAAQVNSDWNATSGVAEILNKPTLTNGTVTSVGLTMPSAFSVANSPITTSGSLDVTGAGTVSQYVRGDGSLANFPASTGGGSSLAFYLNGSVAQGTFGGVAFKEMDRTPVLGAGTDFTINANGYIQSFITDANVPNQLEIPAGNWNFETYFSASSSGGTPSFYVELYKWNGATLSLIASNSATPEGITNGTAIDAYFSALAVPQTTLLATDRLAIRIYVTHSGRTITLHTENSHLCEVITTFSTGLTALNGLTAQVQNLATGTSGTDFGISSATSTHTFNLPTASAANRGALSSADWTTFNNKQAALVSGTNIKTVNSTSLVGSGNVAVEPTITAGTTGQYYRGDKTFQTLDKTAIGLANVDNTSDANKPVSTATQTALNLKEDSANKQNSLDADGTGAKFPTVDAVNSLSMIDRGKRMVSFFTDFITLIGLDGGQSTVASGGSSTIANGGAIPNRTNQQGVIAFQTGTTSAFGYVTYYGSSGSQQLWFGGGAWIFETLINISALSTLLERYRLIFGFGSVISNAAETDGVFITYDEGGTANGTVASANWQCVTVANSVRTLTTTTTAVTAAAWNKLRIEVNAAGTSVTFYVNGTAIATHTTNIPLPSNSRYFHMKMTIAKQTGLTSRAVYCDYVGYENILTTPRT
jgi:hypothetical protein